MRVLTAPAALWEYKRYILGCPILALLCGGLYCGLSTKVFESRAQVLVFHKNEASPGSPTPDRQDFLAGILALFQSRIIAQEAIALDRQSGFFPTQSNSDQEKMLLGKILVTSLIKSKDAKNANPLAFEVRCRAQDPVDCMQSVANLIRTFQSHIISPTGTWQKFTKTQFDVQTISEPRMGELISLRPLEVLSGAVLIGVVVGCCLAWLFYATDHSFRSPQDVSRALQMPVIGLIPIASTPPLLPKNPQSRYAEAYREIRTVLLITHPDAKLIAITSACSGDGRSTVIANLAFTLAQGGKKTLLIDVDLRRNRPQTFFDVPNDQGLISILCNETHDVWSAIKPSGVANLEVLPAGPCPVSSSDLLLSAKFKKVLQAARERYDLVLIDSPPLLAVTDPMVIASMVDGVLLVIRGDLNIRRHAERSAEILRTIHAKCLGVIVNAVGRW